MSAAAFFRRLAFVMLLLVLFGIRVIDAYRITPENVHRLTEVMRFSTGEDVGSLKQFAFENDMLALTTWSALYLWRLNTGEYYKQDFTQSGGYVPAVLFRDDHPYGAYLGYRGGIALVDMVTGGVVMQVDVQNRDYKHQWAFSKDRRRLVAIDYESTIGVFDTYTGEKYYSIITPENYRLARINPLYSPDETVLALIFIREGEGNHHEVFLFDAQTGTHLRTLRRDALPENITYGLIYDLAFSPDGRYLMAAASHTPRRRGEEPDSWVIDLIDQSAAFHVWDVANGVLVNGWHEGELVAHDVTFSADGRYAAGYGPYNFWLWDAAQPMDSGRALVLETFTRESNRNFQAIAVNADGTLAAASTNDGEIRLYDTARATLIASLHEGTLHIEWLDFSADGRFLITAHNEGAVRFWSIDGYWPYAAAQQAISSTLPTPVVTPTAQG